MRKIEDIKGVMIDEFIKDIKKANKMGLNSIMSVEELEDGVMNTTLLKKKNKWEIFDCVIYKIK